MSADREYSLAEIAVMLQQPIEAIMAAKSRLPIWPTRRDAAGQPFFNQRSLSLFHRLIVERDGTALLEPPEAGAYERYLTTQLPGTTFRGPTAGEQQFIDLLLTDVAAAEAQYSQ